LIALLSISSSKKSAFAGLRVAAQLDDDASFLDDDARTFLMRGVAELLLSLCSTLVPGAPPTLRRFAVVAALVELARRRLGLLDGGSTCGLQVSIVAAAESAAFSGRPLQPCCELGNVEVVVVHEVVVVLCGLGCNQKRRIESFYRNKATIRSKHEWSAGIVASGDTHTHTHTFRAASFIGMIGSVGDGTPRLLGWWLESWVIFLDDRRMISAMPDISSDIDRQRHVRPRVDWMVGWLVGW
jgi:hypothetical protein